MAERRNSLVGWGPDVGEPTTLVLVRHGETPLTGEKRFSGTGGSDPELTEIGREQACRVGTELASFADYRELGRHAPFGRIDAVVSSPLVRTRQTAEAVASTLGIDEIAITDGIRECAFGDWDGYTYAEVSERWPKELSAWLADPTYRAPGGESFADVSHRVEEARRELVEAYRGKTVALVSHVTPIKCFTRDVLGAPLNSLFRLELAPTSLTVVEWYADDVGSLRMFNHTAHLLHRADHI